MGKRKMHGAIHYQCDWTGLPMNQTNCYMPCWNDQGKLTKHGSYCCWEAVLAHAQDMIGSDADDSGFNEIKAYVDRIAGVQVAIAPHWKRLAWLHKDGDITTVDGFIAACTEESEQSVTAVCVSPDGTAHEINAAVTDLTLLKMYLTEPKSVSSGDYPQSFQTAKTKATKSEADITVVYWPNNNGLPLNQQATARFKMQIYGDVLLVKQTKELCITPRTRYISYTLADYNAADKGKRKRESTDTLSSTEYADAKRQMTSELQAVEQQASASALAPSDLAKAAVLPPPSGQELAALVRAKGRAPAWAHRTQPVALEAAA